MKRELYLTKRNQLLAQAEKLIDSDQLDQFDAKVKEINDLDDEYEMAAKTQANLRALYNDSAIVANLADYSVSVDGKPFARTSFSEKHKGDDKMKNATEIKAFQMYLSKGGDMRSMPENLRNVLTTSGSGAVLPVDIYQKMITSDAYSDLLHRATVISQGGAGVIKIPIASDTNATWKEEGAAVTPTNPTLTSIDLAGVELMRALSYSAAVDTMSVENFVDLMATLISAEVVETLEKAFISGSTESGQPHDGLDNLTWTSGVNMVETASSTVEIAASDVAQGLSLLPQKYARNAVLLMNANTAYNVVGLFKGTNEYAYNMADGASRFMSREIVISEHCNDGIYIVDPQQLYVRFAMQPTMEVDRSSGFLSATTNMRCLCVVDYAWNPAACVKVCKKSA